MDQPRDPRLDLPGSASPPVEGRRWFWIKLGAWGLAIGLIVAVSVVASLVLGTALQGAGEAVETWRRQAAEAPRDLDAPPDQPPPEPVIGPNGEVIRDGSWARRPRPEFPSTALDAGIQEGAVELRCEVSSSGRVEACEVLSETPPGYGFGPSALAAAAEARLSPRTVDGVATAGSMRFTIRYRLDQAGS